MSHVLYSNCSGSYYVGYGISRAVSIVSHYMKCLDKTHWEVVKVILRYLRGQQTLV